jgi:hypothetical protein
VSRRPAGQDARPGTGHDGYVPDSKPAPHRPPAADPAAPGPDDRPVLPLRSLDDSDTGWGERDEPDDDERLREDRPPHWDPR